jgi:hypothetical protein
MRLTRGKEATGSKEAVPLCQAPRTGGTQQKPRGGGGGGGFWEIFLFRETFFGVVELPMQRNTQKHQKKYGKKRHSVFLICFTFFSTDYGLFQKKNMVFKPHLLRKKNW